MTKEIEAANEMSSLGAKTLKLQEMKEFQSQYNNMINAYRNSDLSLSSTITVEKLPEFKEWKPQLLENKEKFLPLIISKMLKGDIFAFSMYKDLDSHLIDYREVHDNKELKEEFAKYGGAEDGMAVLNARHWLMTSEAVEVFNHHAQGHNVECKINEVLGVVNQHIDCTESLGN